MNARDLLRELAYPFTRLSIVLAMLFFWLLFVLAVRAGLFGIALAFLTGPACLRYLVYLLEARANGREPPVPSIEMFNPADNLWTLTPLVFLAVLLWSDIMLGSGPMSLAGDLVRIAIVIVTPASLAVLAVTHSPAESLSPVAILRMMRACGAAYVLVPGVIVLVSLLATMLSGIAGSLSGLVTSYQVTFLFGFTGAILYEKQVAIEIDIEPAVEKSAEVLGDDLERKRQNVASHAYGFISRGNREGGFAHIEQHVRTEPDATEAGAWFVDQMFRWESREPALFFAQRYLSHLLHHGHGRRAFKLISRCLHEDPRWRPAAADREAVRTLLAEAGRTDLLEQLDQ